MSKLGYIFGLQSQVNASVIVSHTGPNLLLHNVIQTLSHNYKPKQAHNRTIKYRKKTYLYQQLKQLHGAAFQYNSTVF